MLRRDAGAVLEAIGRVFGRGPGSGSLAGLGEAGLLDRFAAGGDEAAFAAIVARHGPMVRGVCRRALGDSAEADDAFQATFLVLVRRARSIRDGDRLGPWLHGVARRVAARAKARRARRSVVESDGSDLSVAEGRVDGSATLADPETLAALDDELARLPETLRAPLVLCYLEGLTHDEAADRLRWPVGTVRSRMARARSLLRGRLDRRGFSPSTVGLAVGRSLGPLPSPLVDATTRASLAFLQSPRVFAGPAVALAQGVITAMNLFPLKVAAATGLVALASLGGTALAYQARSALPGNAVSPAQADTSSQDVAKPVASASTQDYRTILLELEGIANEVRQASLVTDTDQRVAILRKVADDLQMAKSRLDAAIASRITTGKPGTEEKSDRPVGGMGMAAGGSPVASGRSGGLPGMERGTPGEPVERSTPTAPKIVDANGYLYVIAADGSGVAVTRPDDEGHKYLRLSGTAERPHGVSLILADRLTALSIRGEGISRLAVFDLNREEWMPTELDSPISNAVPQGDSNAMTYQIGTHYYRYSTVTGLWNHIDTRDLLKPELPGAKPGEKASPLKGGPGGGFGGGIR